jgi:predicted glycoside hydrolase/deacetylase ChbG (UPF0249 family)
VKLTADISPRRLILIADDYGISPGVSAGIRQLAEKQRLSGTGVMATMPSWPGEAASLRELHGKIAVGLHFTLTDQVPLGTSPKLAPNGKFMPVGKLLLAGITGNIPRQEVADQLERQLDSFEKHFGAPPDFIDGHQHAHIFPGIWPSVLEVFGRRVDPAECWLRDCRDFRLRRRGQAFKAGVIAILSRAASNAARDRKVRSNRGFSGFYDYGAGDLAKYFLTMLRDTNDGHCMMVHPGHADDILRSVDSLTDPREQELAFLLGEEFPRQLAQAGFVLAGLDWIRESGQTAAP